MAAFDKTGPPAGAGGGNGGTAMAVRSIGHAVLKVRDLTKAEGFYHGVLGMPIAVRSNVAGPQMTFFTLGNHHDLAVVEMGPDAPAPDPRGVGLAHVAFNVGTSREELAAMKAHLEANGVRVDRAVDHGVTLSLYLRDPDGNGIELYVDVSDAWRADPAEIVNTYEKLAL
jgi:catechol 2,3-dioxygenase